MNALTITLNTTGQDFANWLKDYTSTAYLDFFPMSKGGCTLQPARETTLLDDVSSPDDVVLIAIDAFYWDGDLPRSGSIHPWENALTFRMVKLAAQQIDVTITCHYDPIMRYRNDLLVSILMRWPETQTQLSWIDSLENEPPPPTTSIWHWPLSDE